MLERHVHVHICDAVMANEASSFSEMEKHYLITIDSGRIEVLSVRSVRGSLLGLKIDQIVSASSSRQLA